MALNAYAQLTANGAALDGNTSVTQMASVDVSNDHLECYSVKWGSVLNERSSGRIRSQVKKLGIIFTKPLDKTTPLLYQALVQNQRIDGTIKIFDNDPDTGETRHFFSVSVEQARIISVESTCPNTLGIDTATLPTTEQVELLVRTLTYTDEINGIEFEDT